jgi:hypothetical protein
LIGPIQRVAGDVVFERFELHGGHTAAVRKPTANRTLRTREQTRISGYPPRMDDASRLPSHEEELQAFRVVVRHILDHGELPPACLDFDLALIQKLGDIVRAVRDGSRTGDLVRDAWRVFADYAFRTEGITQQQRGSKSA